MQQAGRERHEVGIFRGQYASGYNGGKACEEQSWQRDIRELPETCVIFELGIGLRFLKENFDTVTLYDRLPCFLDNPECIAVKGHPDICFTKGGYGCPAAVDTLETVRALGVKRILVVGMCGGFGKEIQVGDVVVPDSILCEEGTSHHYFETVEFVRPEEAFLIR